MSEQITLQDPTTGEVTGFASEAELREYVDLAEANDCVQEGFIRAWRSAFPPRTRSSRAARL